MRMLVLAAALAAGVTGAAAQQRSPVTLPTDLEDIVWDAYVATLRGKCHLYAASRPDAATEADLSRRISDHAFRMHGPTGGAAVLGALIVAGRMSLPLAPPDDPNIPLPGHCRHDWDAVSRHLESYRRDRTLDTPRRR